MSRPSIKRKKKTVKIFVPEVHYQMPCPNTLSSEGCDGFLWLIKTIGDYDTPCMILQLPKVNDLCLHEDRRPKTVEEFSGLNKDCDTPYSEDSLI
jgi:hypothetical protein